MQERLGRQVSDQDEGKNVNENRLEEFPKDVQGIAPDFKEAVENPGQALRLGSPE